MTKNLKTTITFVLLTLVSTITYGQKEMKINEKDSTKHWEIGIDLLGLIDKNQVPATSAFIRYNFVNSNNSKRAWRLRLGVNTSLYDSAQILAPRKDEINAFAPFIRPGYEWQKDITRKASYFYGIDLSVLYSQNKSKLVLPPFNSSLYQDIDKTWEFGAFGFIGIKYMPVNWLAISTESSLNFHYRIRHDKNKVTNINYPEGIGGQGTVDVNKFSTGFSPIAVVNICYYISHK